MRYPTQEQIDKWQYDPKNWKWRLFYYNKEDSRIIVNKNPEWMGVTLNFANPKAYLAVLCFFAFFGFIIYMIEHNAH